VLTFSAFEQNKISSIKSYLGPHYLLFLITNLGFLIKVTVKDSIQACFAI